MLIVCPYPFGKMASQRLKYEQHLDYLKSKNFNITISSFFGLNTWNIEGTISIGSNAGGIPDAITNRENGLLIEPNNPTKTAEAIYELFNDEKLYNQLSENGITRIKENFSINKVGGKYMDIISKYYDY